MIKAIFFDIDGTLRDFEEKGIPEYTRRALDMAREAGMRLCIATGRHWLEIEEEGLLGDLEFDAYVTLNGQLCYVREGRELPGRAIYKNPIDPGQVRRLLKMMEEEPFPCLFMEEGRMYINYTDPRVELVQRGIGTALPPVGDIGRALENPVYQIVPYVDAKRAGEIIAGLPGCGHAMWHAGNAVDLLPFGGGKCGGIERTLEYFGMKAEEAAAVGDGKNDVSMLAYVGVGVAMGNGCEEAKRAADLVVERIELEGLLEAVEGILRR